MATSLLLSFLTFCLLLRASTSQEDTCHSTFGFNVFHYYTSVLHRQKLQPLIMNEGPQINGRDPSEPSFEFTGGSGLVIKDNELTSRMASSLCSSNKLNLYSSVFFKKDQHGGTSLELYHINETFLGLSICRKVNEIYVTYRHGNRLRFETFPYKFSSGKWYKLAVMFSGNLLTVFVNCALLEKRIVPLPDYCPSKINLNIITGSGCLTKELSPCRTGFTGSLQNVELSISKSDNVKGCNESAQCPVCASFLTLLKKYVELQNNVTSLNDLLRNCSKTLSSVNCTNHHAQSSRSCIIHESSYPDGSFVKNSTGHICYCRDGVAQCIPSSSIQTAREEEEETQTKSTPSVAPAATQTCLPNDDYGVTVTLALGEKKYFPLPSTNECGILTCKTFGTFLYNAREEKSCAGVPSSHCNSQSLDDQKLAVCCNRCTVCESELARCPNNSSCVPNGVDYSCECNKGFVMTNSNTSCIDINECTAGTHNCPADATCENTIGSFDCKCSKGYTLSEENNETLQCIDIDECRTGRAQCDNNSVCENTNGGYNCKCNHGYAKMNERCVAVCDKKCQNGGKCVSPNNCSCVAGFTGAHCQYDIDECEIGIHECTHNISKCINTHGGYFCSCEEGYQWQWKGFKGYCVDVNECASGIHYCPSLNNCQNVFKGYRCTCDGNQCTGSCKYEDEYIPEGQTKSLGCDTCVCKEGNLICEKKPCNCDSNEDRKCCPQCFSKEFCQINKVNLEVGDYLIDDNDRCIRRQCLKAQDNQLSINVFNLSMECSPLTDCPPGHSYIPEGGCCPVCQLPPCTATSRPPSVSTNCETCECDGNSWSCNEAEKCPTHKELGCLKEELVQLPDQCCPVCYTSVINDLTCLSSISN